MIRALSALGLFGSLVLVAYGCSSTAESTPADAGADAAPEEDAAPVCPTAPTPAPFVKGTTTLPMDGTLRVNHIQAKATHNSYHRIPKATVPEWQYDHVPLDRQFDEQGVRGVELDIHWDDECGRYKVFHIGLLDDLTSCTYLVECLVAMRGWSASHPGHHPIFVQIEPKFTSSAADGERLSALDKEILSVFERPWLVTPDELKGSSASVAEGLAQRGWPTLGEARGRFVFYLNTGGSVRDAYTFGRKNLDGRLMFAEGNLDEPFVAIQVSNDPIGDADAIKRALAKNLIVRTRADSDPSTAKTNQTAAREAAFASGAQIVSTDFPAQVPSVPYFVTVPEGTPSRCAPTVAPQGCTSLAIEDPSKLAR